MARRIEKHFRGNVVAYIALFFALSAGAYALPGRGSVDSGDIKNSAIKSTDVKTEGVRGVDVDESTLDLGVYNWVQTSGLDSVSPKEATATCPNDDVLVGSGGHISGAGASSVALHSIDTSTIEATPTSVTVRGQEVGPGTDQTWRVHAFAVCAEIAG